LRLPHLSRFDHCGATAVADIVLTCETDFSAVFASAGAAMKPIEASVNAIPSAFFMSFYPFHQNN